MHVKAMLIALLAGVSLLFSCGKSNSEPTQPKDVAVTSVTLNQVSIELKVGESVQLTATIQPSNATSKTITWSSSNSAVASIANGLLTAIGEGSATITASAGGKSTTCKVTVTKKTISVTSVSLDRTSITLEEEKTTTLIATVKPDDATDKTVTWSSSSASVATVDANGKVIAIKEGAATITAKAGDKSATCEVTVKKKIIAVESIELDKTELDLNKGNSTTLSATVKPDNATDKTVTWSSVDETIATVDQTGKVIAVGKGETTIKAKAGEKEASCKVNVTVPVESVSLDKTNFSIEEGQKATLTATVKPDDASDKSVMWSSSDASIASVQNGEVTAIKAGEATIYANASGKTAECKITVTPKNIPVESVELNKTNLSLYEGGSETLTATVKPSNATDKTVTWNTSDANVATVDQEGKVTAIKEGSATITAKAGEKTADCQVTVQKDPMNDPIVFADNAVKELLVAAFDKNNDGELSYLEAASVKQLGNVFAADRTITSFNEFQYFTQVMQIPDECFKNSSQLSSIVLPPAILTIGRQAFYGCTSIKTVSLPTSVQVYGDECFSKTGLTSIMMPDNATFGIGCFKDCKELISANIPSNTSIMYKDLFSGCSKLSSISISSGVSKLSEGCFRDCSSLSNIVLPNTIITLGVAVFSGCSSLKEIIIPDSVTTIDSPSNNSIVGCFYGCTSLESVTISNNLNIIPNSMLYGCEKISSISIPSSVKQIGNMAFQGCSSLKEIIIPNSITKIGAYAFAYCSSLKGIIVPDSVTEIGDGAFEYSGLTSTTLPKSMMTISNMLFCGCSQLTEVILPESITSIGERSFEMTAMEKIIIPKSVTYIGHVPFQATHLKEIYIYATTPPTLYAKSSIPYFPSTGVGADLKIYVPGAAYWDYRDDAVWSYFKSIIYQIPW